MTVGKCVYRWVGVYVGRMVGLPTGRLKVRSLQMRQLVHPPYLLQLILAWLVGLVRLQLFFAAELVFLENLEKGFVKTLPVIIDVLD